MPSAFNVPWHPIADNRIRVRAAAGLPDNLSEM
jgi:hypothetical protein